MLRYRSLCRYAALFFVLGCLLVDNGTAEERLRFDLQSYGEFSHRDTNFYRDDYDAIAGWWENLLVLRCKQLFNNKVIEHLLFEPYIKVTLASSENGYPWENNIVYGFGLENRILDKWEILETPFLNWLQRLRLYVEYLNIDYTKDEAEEWVPDYDVRYGFDLWKEWNIPPEEEDSYIWGELWANFGWRKTNFFDSNYETYSGGLMGRCGVKPKTTYNIGGYLKVSLLPYIMIETSVSGEDFFWENRFNIGGGIRLMSVFAWEIDDQANNDGHKSRDKEIIIRFFVERLHTADYYKGEPTPETPDDDLRVGVNFSYNLF